MKLALAALFATAIAQAATVAQCIELPYAGMPRQFWEREMVWMKNIGATCAAVGPGPDLSAILSIARKLELPAWVITGTVPADQSEAHGGPVRTVPTPICEVSAVDPKALLKARTCFEKRAGTLLWRDVEPTVTPLFHRAAVSFQGVDQPALTALRRQIDLFREWQTLLPTLTVEQPIQSTLKARQYLSADAVPISAVSVINDGAQSVTTELKAQYPPLKQTIKLPSITVPAGDALWLPVNLPFSKAHGCNTFANDEAIIYATAELTRVECDNGTLAMEFSAPNDSDVVLHLAKEPIGPYIADGRPRPFDWDASSGRARLNIPPGNGPAHRVRIALALAEPENSAFFGDRKVLLIGQKNSVSTQYSSEAVATRSRLVAPAWFKPVPNTKTPNEVEYAVTVPDSIPHGSHVELHLQIDGVDVNHARLQCLLPVTLRFREALNRHYGDGADLALDPPLIPVDGKTGRDITIAVRNNAPEIRMFTVEVSGDDGLDFATPRSEIVVAASAQRDVNFHLFADRAGAGVHTAHVKVTGAAAVQSDFRILVIPRSETVAYTEAGYHVLESQHARVVYTPDRLLEFVWKDDERNVIPEGGYPLGRTRIKQLQDAELTVEGPALPLKPGKQGDVKIAVGPNTYRLSR